LIEGQRSIAIVGFGGSRRETPWDDPTWAIWTMNDAPTQFAKRADAHFEMHNADVRKRAYTDVNGRLYLASLAKIAAQMPLYMLSSEVPGALAYPLDVMLAYFKADYFASSADYMLALAIYTAETKPELYAKRLGFWGIEMAPSVEYARERATFDYWYGRALERGFELVGGPQPIGYRYGYSDPELERVKTQVKKRQADIQHWISQMEVNEREQAVQLEALRDRLKEFRGMLRETEWVLQTQTDVPPAGVGPK
jgi:hypothetical protein